MLIGLLVLCQSYNSEEQDRCIAINFLDVFVLLI